MTPTQRGGNRNPIFRKYPIIHDFSRKHDVNKLPLILLKNVKKISNADFPIIAYITPFLSAIFQDIAIIFGFFSYYLIEFEYIWFGGQSSAT